jgi:TetR/AcrR family transcriptional regulator
VLRTDLKQRSVTARNGISLRPQGRPSDSQDVVGREALIRAARALLARLPPAKVTRAAVAREAGVDPSLIRYYFKDRASLLLAVLEQIVRGRSVLTALDDYETAADALRAYVRGFFAFHTENPFFHRLLIEEIAQSESPAAREAFHRLDHMAIDGLTEILARGSSDKTLIPADPALLHIAIIGMCEFFFSSGVLLEDALGDGIVPDDVAERYGDLITDMVLRGIARR